jgi:hypothetical protein
MPITRTPMVDDDGSGQHGTVVNNAWKSELYDQIDGALPAATVPAPGAAGNLLTSTGAAWSSAPPRTRFVELLYTIDGSIAPTGAVNMATVPISGLDLKDTLEIFWDVWVAGPATTSIQCDLYAAAPTAAQLITLVGADAGSDLTGYALGSYRILIRPTPTFAGQMLTTAYGVVTIGAPQGRGYVWARNATASSWIGAWSLLARIITPPPAGTPINYSVQVYRHRGAAGLTRDDAPGVIDEAAPVDETPRESRPEGERP